MPAVDPAGAAAIDGDVDGDIRDAVSGHIVELQLHVRIEEPVNAAGKVIQNAAVETGAIQVEVVVAGSDLPGTFAEHVAAFAGHQKEVFIGDDPVEARSLKAIF